MGTETQHDTYLVHVAHGACGLLDYAFGHLGFRLEEDRKYRLEGGATLSNQMEKTER